MHLVTLTRLAPATKIGLPLLIDTKRNIHLALDMTTIDAHAVGQFVQLEIFTLNIHGPKLIIQALGNGNEPQPPRKTFPPGQDPYTPVLTGTCKGLESDLDHRECENI